MSHELKEGVKLKAITTPPDPQDGYGYYLVGNGLDPIKDIVVVEQMGQASMVPWAMVLRKSGQISLVNLANVESVELA